MTKLDREYVRRYKHEVNSAKHELIIIESKIRDYSEAEADKLSKIIGRLEDWQNRGSK